MLIYLQTLETPEEKSLFEQIYLEYRGLMYHVAYEILHNEQEAEDAVHQAFVKIAENIKKIDASVCPRTHSYVVTIVEHQAIDQYRRMQKHPSNISSIKAAVEHKKQNGKAKLYSYNLIYSMIIPYKVL